MLKNFALASLTALVTLLACSTRTPIGAANHGTAGTTGASGVSPGTAGLNGDTAGTIGGAGTIGAAGVGAGVDTAGIGAAGTTGGAGTTGAAGQAENAGEVACMAALAAGKPGGSMFLAEKILPGVANSVPAGGLVLGDFNGDQKADVAMGFTTDPASMPGAAGTGGGAQYDAVGMFLTNGAGDLAAPVVYAYGGGLGVVNALAAGDLDGDAKLDLIVSDGNVQIFTNKGAGALAGPVTYSPGKSQRLGLGDLNGDGRLDIVTSTSDTDQSGVPTTGLSVLTSAGAGSFIGTHYLVTGGSPEFVVGDLTGDGKPEVAMSGTAGVDILLNDGKGSLLIPFPTYLAPPLGVIASGDVDGDGIVDLVVGGGGGVFFPGGGGAIDALHGLGNAAFAVATKLTDSVPYASFALADVDGDHKLDLVEPFPDCGAVGVFLNDGAGRFASATYYRIAGLLGTPAVGDVNGDGRADIVVPNGKTASVLLHAAP
jgi:FG-GAP-like repeat